MAKVNILGFTRSQLEKELESLGQKSFRGRQIFKWVYQRLQDDFLAMTDLTRDLRTSLDEQYEIQGLEIQEKAVSKDGTEKFLFRLDDGHPMESVLIPDDERGRKAVCISSQAGCALACGFCATGTMGLLRDLTVGEIVGQLMYLRILYGRECFHNVVLMGMGEPLNNYSNLIEALQIMTDSIGLGLGAKRITVSTSGVTPRIRKLADSRLNVRLALSLHTAIQEKRERIMPVARTFALDKLIDAVRYYAEVTGQRVTFEYILFDGFNDTLEDIKALARLVEGIPCKINILAYNPVPGLPFSRPSDEKVDWFGRQLYPRTPAVTVRKSRGRDIDAACGQLAARKVHRGVA
jgi:23S rRNA (adenine2503-C2)-methyltransferase